MFRHVLERHAGLVLRAKDATAWAGIVRVCVGCGDFGRAGSAANCLGCRRPGSDSRPPALGDTVRSKDPAAAGASVTSRPSKWRAPSGAALHAVPCVTTVVDAGAVVSEDVVRRAVARVEEGEITRALGQVRSWTGGETIVNIPVRARPALAVIFGTLLSGAVEGDARAGGLLQVLPRLLLHRSVLGRPGSFAVGATLRGIARRVDIFLRAGLDALLRHACQAKAGARRRGAEISSRRPGAAKSGSTRRAVVLARGGAFSKAVKSLGASVLRLTPGQQRSWAAQLIPRCPLVLAAREGPRPVSDPERATWSARATSASARAPPSAVAPLPSVCSGDSRPGSALAAEAAAAAAVPAGSAADGGADGAAGSAGDCSRSCGGSAGGEPLPLGSSDASHRPPPGGSPALPEAVGYAYGKGVRFGALSAPGPSGFRAEHARAFELARRHAAARCWRRAMESFVERAVEGKLPASCRWMLSSSLTFIEKPGGCPGDAPRPIRVGEVLRRWVAKWLMASQRDVLATVFLRLRQFGIAVPGGAEALVHHRALRAARSAAGGLSDGSPAGSWDNDFRNAFGSLFWGRIDEGVQRWCPAALPWTRWCHEGEVEVVLPSGDLAHANRGAEQGDPLGPFYCGVTIADVCVRALALATQLRDSIGDAPPLWASVFQALGGCWRSGLTAEDADLASWLEEWIGGVNDRIASLGADASRCAAEWDAAVRRAWGDAAIGSPPGCLPPPRPASADSLGSRRGHRLGVVDSWYLDDSDLWGRLVDGDLFLAALDREGWLSGLQRNSRKSYFRLIPGSATVGAAPPWSAATATIVANVEDAEWKVLGAHLVHVASRFAARTDSIAGLHQSVRAIEDPAVELTLIRQCASVNKVTYLLRAVGPPIPGWPSGASIPWESLAAYDGVMDETVGGILGGDVGADGLDQASWGVRAGGLGMRRATAAALPAHVAALAESEGLVTFLESEGAGLGVATSSARGHTHASRVDAALAVLVGEVGGADSHLGSSIAEAVTEARAARSRWVQEALGLVPSTRRPAGEGGGTASVPSLPRVPAGGADSALADVGVEDSEHPRAPSRGASAAGGQRGAASGLQHRLQDLLDTHAVARAIEDAEGSGEAGEVVRALRLRDLAGETAAHEWLWSICPAHGEVLRPGEFLTAVRLRLGLPLAVYRGSLPCGSCGSPVGAAELGVHALVCAKGERTLGHNRLRDALGQLCELSDPRTAIEQMVGGVEGDDMDGRLRPADVLTSAAPFGGCGLAALDVSIVSPLTAAALGARGGGTSRRRDCLQEAVDLKNAKYEDLCRASGWRFQACLVSAFGCRHPAFEGTVSALCRAAARRLGGDVDAARLAASWWRRAGTLIMHRNACMVARCRPVEVASAGAGGISGGFGVDEDAWDGDPSVSWSSGAAPGPVGGAFYGRGGR